MCQYEIRTLALDITTRFAYTVHIVSQESESMPNSYLAATKTKYRVTLELEVLEDMNPHQIQWEKVLDLEPAERVRVYVEDLSTPDRW